MHLVINLRMILAKATNGIIDPEISDFIPIDEITPTDSDLDLYFLSANNIKYARKVNDPWYAAHRYFTRVHGVNVSGTIPTYMADEAASVLGCSVRIQLCDLGLPSDRRCTKLASNADTFRPNLSLGERALNMSSWVTSSAYVTRSVVANLRASSLTSRYTMYGSSQALLPDNQWQMDVEYWHNIALASLQRSVVTSAAGPQDADVANKLWRRPESEQERYFCNNQVR